MSFAANLKRLRNNAGLTQFQLAEHANVSYESIQRYEQARVVPKSYVMERLAKHFGITVDELKGGQGEAA